MRRVRLLASRLLSVFRSASKRTKREGAAWYADASRVARKLARLYGVSHATAAGVIAAISPRLTWKYNVRAAEMVLAWADKVPGVFKASLAKAWRIRRGERPLKVLSGPKVRAFYRALMGDESAAVVDVWTARAAGVSPEHASRHYDTVAQALTLAANQARTSVARLQATAWVQVRGRAA